MSTAAEVKLIAEHHLQTLVVSMEAFAPALIELQRKCLDEIWTFSVLHDLDEAIRRDNNKRFP